MSELVRFGVSIEKDLLEHFDLQINRKNYSNRSEAIRDLIRDSLISDKLENDSQTLAIASLTLIYDHHAAELLSQMAAIQHTHHELVLSVMHIHVSHRDCMEILALRGKIGDITNLSYGLISLRGIKHGKLFLTLPSSDITK